MQIGFLFTAVIATVLFVCVPFDIIPALYAVLYVLFVLAPQVVVLLLQLHKIKKKYISMVCDILKGQHDKSPKKPLCAEFISVYTSTHAMLKSQGINPNRAGPGTVYA